jgi:DNA-binding transcriptional regulator YiaG
VNPKQELVELKIDAVALCAQGMNPEAHIVLLKSADTPEGPVLKAQVASLLKAKRQERELTQEKLASLTRVSVRAVKSWESSESTPSPLSAYQLACVLDLSDDERDMLHRAMHAPRG